ncbi:MAG: alpha/beta hydrolase [Pseudomonadota bacterium]
MRGDAPLHTELSGVPAGGAAFWTRAEDGTRLRFALWQGGTRGTVLLFPGRTEYIEKYGLVVERLMSFGLSIVVIDWRGQGLSDRPIPGKSIGYVEDFAEYQSDLAAVLGHEMVASLPGPRLLMAHSMGGCIGLRALLSGLDVAGSVFSAPMWGINLPLAPLSRAVITLGARIGFAKAFAPMTGGTTLVLAAKKPEGNPLTTDLDVFRRLQDHARAVPELTLGGASFGWLSAAFRETAALAEAEPAKGPILTFLGTEERIVEAEPIHRQSGRQPHAELVLCEGAQHEIWMERPETQAPVWERIEAFLGAHLGPTPTAGDD